MVDSVLEVKQIKQLSADGGATVLDVQNQTIAVGSITDAAGTGAPEFPNGIEPAIIAFSGQLAADITASGSTTWTYSTTNKIDTESAESGGIYTIPKTGKYKLSVSALIDRPGTSLDQGEYVDIKILNGTTILVATGSIGYYLYSYAARINGSCGIIADLTAGDEIKVQSYHSTTSGYTFGSYVSRFNLLYLGS